MVCWGVRVRASCVRAWARACVRVCVRVGGCVRADACARARVCMCVVSRYITFEDPPPLLSPTSPSPRLGSVLHASVLLRCFPLSFASVPSSSPLPKCLTICAAAAPRSRPAKCPCCAGYHSTAAADPIPMFSQVSELQSKQRLASVTNPSLTTLLQNPHALTGASDDHLLRPYTGAGSGTFSRHNSEQLDSAGFGRLSILSFAEPSPLASSPNHQFRDSGVWKRSDPIAQQLNGPQDRDKVGDVGAVSKSAQPTDKLGAWLWAPPLSSQPERELLGDGKLTSALLNAVVPGARRKTNVGPLRKGSRVPPSPLYSVSGTGRSSPVLSF